MYISLSNVKTLIVASVTRCSEIIMEREHHSRPETERLRGSADICGFSYLSGKAPALIVTGLSTASAPDKEGIEGRGKGKPTGCPDDSAENSTICKHSVYAPLF